MPVYAALNAKMAHIQDQIATLEARKQTSLRVGGFTQVDWRDEVAFHQARLAELQWAQTANDGDIRARIASYAATLPPAALARKYGSMAGLAQDQIATLANIEVLEIAMGTHPALPAEWRNPMGVF